MTVIRNSFAAVILIALVSQAFAIDGRPPPPEDVFRYVLYDAGDAIDHRERIR